MDGRPLDVLEAALGDVVTARLKDGEVYRGELSGFDQHMNLVLEPPDGEVDAPEEFGGTPVEDTIVIRGDNLVSINP